MKRRTTMLALAGLFATGGGWMLARREPGATAFTQDDFLPGAAHAQEAEGEIDTTMVEEMTLGDENAPVTLMEYASFTCPHCARFSTEVFPKIEENYIATGKVRFVYRDVYFDRFGLWAAMMARCGGAEKFFPIAEEIYATQRDWATKETPAEIADEIRKIGLKSGLDKEDLDACMNDSAMAEALLAWFEENKKADEVTATPTLFIDGEKHSNMSYEDLAELLDARLEAAGHSDDASEEDGDDAGAGDEADEG